MSSEASGDGCSATCCALIALGGSWRALAGPGRPWAHDPLPSLCGLSSYHGTRQSPVLLSSNANKKRDSQGLSWTIVAGPPLVLKEQHAQVQVRGLFPGITGTG